MSKHVGAQFEEDWENAANYFGLDPSFVYAKIHRDRYVADYRQAIRREDAVTELVKLVPGLCDYAESATLEGDPLPQCVIDAKLLLQRIEALKA